MQKRSKTSFYGLQNILRRCLIIDDFVMMILFLTLDYFEQLFSLKNVHVGMKIIEDEIHSTKVSKNSKSRFRMALCVGIFSIRHWIISRNTQHKTVFICIFQKSIGGYKMFFDYFQKGSNRNLFSLVEYAGSSLTQTQKAIFILSSDCKTNPRLITAIQILEKHKESGKTFGI